jgi:alcohol dehydrogenase
MAMKAWKLREPGGELMLADVPLPELRWGSVIVRMQAAPLLTYFEQWAAGQLPYAYPRRPFTPGTNGVGVIDAVGPGVYHFKRGDRVYVDPFLVTNENVAEPAQILTGLTGIGANSEALLADWADGTYAEYVLMPPSVLTSLQGLEGFAASRLAPLSKFAIPLGGLLRGALAPTEALIVNGATGYFGSAAVLLGVALGARVVVALGRSHAGLARLAERGGARVKTVRLTGDVQADIHAAKEAAGGPVDMGLDIVGRASDPNSTLTALQVLRRGGRLVLMGSMSVKLPIDYAQVLANNWSIIGNFMYQKDAFRRLVALITTGALDVDRVEVTAFPLAELPAAARKAATLSGLQAVVLTM